MISIERCDPLPFNSDPSDELNGSSRWIRYPVSAHADGMQAFFDVCVASQGAEFAFSETELYRLLCHAIVQQLPNSAFQEAVGSLSEMYTFYQEKPAILAAPAARSLKANVTGSYIAPVYPALEE